MVKSIILLLRPHHYIKNLLVLLPLLFERQLFGGGVTVKGLLGFAAFCLLSSVVYVFNDIRDVDLDRQHEIKRNRPIASGKVSIGMGYGIIAVLLIAIIAVTVLASFGWQAAVFMTLYFAVNLAYSMGLKSIPIVDVTLLASCYVLRVLFGAAVVETNVSSWIYLTILSVSFYLGLGKRRNEAAKTDEAHETRKVLKGYTYMFLDKFMYVCLALSIAFYALWSADSEIIIKYGTDKLIWTVPLVIVMMMKYSADIETDSYGDPVDVVLHDKYLLLLGGLYGIVLIGLLYFPII